MRDGPPFTVDLLHLDGAATIRLSGEIDLSAQPEILGLVGALIEQHPHIPFVLDMSEVTFLDSSGIACLVMIRNMAGPGMVVVQNPGPVPRRVLQLTGLDFLVADVARDDTGS